MDYEEYMRSVLGYSQVPNNIYRNSIYDNYYYDTEYLNNNTRNTELIESMYPEIYRIIYPMICRICTQNSQREITRELIDNMTEEIYLNVEGDDRYRQSSTTTRTVLKNGDVRNPNVKEQENRIQPKERNFVMYDLIRILILRELLRRRAERPTMPPQMRPNRPTMPPIRPF